MTLSKAKIKWVQQLAHKKFRKQYGLFVAEGDKMVSDLLLSMPCEALFYTQNYPTMAADKVASAQQSFLITDEELCKISRLETPQNVLGVFAIPAHTVSLEDLKGNLVLALDGVQDAGNMGTIVRLADWFGITTILCSTTTVDVYNPKVVQATMGALARVHVHYVSLPDVLPQLDMPLYVTALDGDNVYTAPLATQGVIVMGNEGNGVSEQVKNLATHSLLIPNYPIGRTTSESLNVGVATAIVCAEFRRRQL